jgi:hypothetical protein
LLGEYEISVNYENNKDISLAMQTDNGRYTDRILLESDICSIGATSCLTLYKGKRNINGLEVSEWLINQKTLVTTYPTLEYIFELAIHEDKKEGRSPLKLSMYYKVDLLKPDGMLVKLSWFHYGNISLVRLSITLLTHKIYLINTRQPKRLSLILI